MYDQNTGNTELGGVQRQRYQLNVLISSNCKGCRFCDFPYKSQSTIRGKDNKFPEVTYNNEDDVWEMIGDLYAEANEFKSEFSDDPILDVFHQLPFFCCPNIILDQKTQEDIQRYLYCEDTKTQPYPGNYGDVPAKWMSIHFIIKNSIAISQNEGRKKYMKRAETKNKSAK